MTITRIGPMSAARIAGVLYAFMGLFIGCLFSLATMMGTALPPGDNPFAGGMVFGAAAVFVLPILYGFFGFVSTLIAAVIYNALASMLGGIEIETR